MAFGPGVQIRIGPRLSGAVRALIIANALVFLWQTIAQFMGSGDLIQIFGLRPALVLGRLYLWQLVSYLFLHGDFLHILFNMFALWMFGSELERYWGSRSFLRYYFITGIGAGLFSVAADPGSLIPTIGASGAIYGILLAYGMMFPDRYVYLYFLVPVKVKYFVAVMGVLAFVSALGSPGGPVAHIAHLGGMVVGFIYLKGWFSLGRLKQAYYRWKLKQMRKRFTVYTRDEQRPSPPPREKRKSDDDFWIN